MAGVLVQLDGAGAGECTDAPRGDSGKVLAVMWLSHKLINA